MNTTQITVQANIATDIEKTWDFYTQPEHITKWNFASDDWHCPSASNDMQVGGKYSARMEAKDGSWGFDFEATYDKITEGEGFTYTMPDGRKVTVTFKSIDNGTQVTTVFDAETQNPVEMQQQGWQAILDNFKKYAESQA
ncbi:SRPBCC family protein [Runella zeae]|uniref:SRPBCC family protein n=1 Tax=Runella zeae TaxID=94255 RepID=UPI0004195FE2|nr:SRPBCC family protein [Runella zeae]